MEKKRSKGVTFWGWFFIAHSIMGLYILFNLQLFNLQQEFQKYGTNLKYFSVFSCIAYVFCGIFILKLNENARKAAIILGIISIISIPFHIKAEVNTEERLNSIEEAHQKISEEMTADDEYIPLENFEYIINIVFIVVLGGFFLIF